MSNEKLPVPGMCKDCKFSLQTQLDPNSLTRQRMCLRFPPQAIPIFSQQGMQVMTQFPLVMDTMGCFEFDEPDQPLSNLFKVPE